MNAPKRVLLAAQDWESMAGINSCGILTEVKPGQTANVKSMEYAGFLYSAFSTIYGGYTGESVIEAWQLIPEKLYTGSIYLDSDWSSSEHPERQRGDYLGYRVKVKGQPMVCAKSVHFVRVLPTVQPLTLEAAIAYDEEARKYGWRALQFGGQAKVTWRSLAGHPVVMYERDGGKSLAMLLWRYKKQILEYTLHSDVTLAHLEPLNLDMHMAARILPECSQPKQACLF